MGDYLSTLHFSPNPVNTPLDGGGGVEKKENEKLKSKSDG
jgi:hypothetical protein